MIYSLLKNKEVPVSIVKQTQFINDEIGDMTRYSVYDDAQRKFVGYLDLKDAKNGAKVLYIKNEEVANVY